MYFCMQQGARQVLEAPRRAAGRPQIKLLRAACLDVWQSVECRGTQGDDPGEKALHLAGMPPSGPDVHFRRSSELQQAWACPDTSCRLAAGVEELSCTAGPSRGGGAVKSGRTFQDR